MEQSSPRQKQTFVSGNVHRVYIVFLVEAGRYTRVGEPHTTRGAALWAHYELRRAHPDALYFIREASAVLH